MDPHCHRLYWSWFNYFDWMLSVSDFDYSTLKIFFQSAFLDCNKYHFASKVCSRIFSVSSLTACGRIWFFLHNIVDSIHFFCSVACFGLQELFEGWNHINPHKIEDPEDEDPHYKRYTIVYAHAMHHSLVFWRYIYDCIVHWLFFYVSNICSDYLRTFPVWNKKKLLGGCTYVCQLFCNGIHCLCRFMPWIILIILSWSTTLHYIYHDFWTCVQEEL